jgi:hypothetical protein
MSILLLLGQTGLTMHIKRTNWATVKNGFIFSEQKPGNTYIIVQLTQIFT